MPERSRKRPVDLNSLAASIVAESTDEDKHVHMSAFDPDEADMTSDDAGTPAYPGSLRKS